jgi:heme o synthase
LKRNINIILELAKIKITLFVAVTALFGFICAAGKITLEAFIPVIGVLILASGSAAFNHLQEWKTDALMDRTKHRPLPSHKVSTKYALITALSLGITGALILYLSCGLLGLGLGLLNFLWYNGIYTPLKKVTSLAIVPGSLVGAIPPMIGWVAGGGSLYNPQIIMLSFFFFIWQIPHFWLLLLIFNKDYEKAGFPTLTQIFSHDQLARITFMWIIATVVTCITLPLFGIVQNPFINFALLAAGIWLTWNTVKLLRSSNKKIYFNFAFRGINIFAILVVILLSIDKLIV